MIIEVVMRVKLDGNKRPICMECGHSVMSHGERDGKLFCWGCAAVNQEQCKQLCIFTISEGDYDNTRTS
jgi:tRNA(Ile2) C34 agmatinyltransferase TiaS